MTMKEDNGESIEIEVSEVYYDYLVMIIMN